MSDTENIFKPGGSKGIDDFERLFFAYFPVLCGVAETYVGGEVCQDIAQATLIKVWDRWGRFPTMASARSFMYITLRNECLNHIRDSNKMTGISGDIALSENSDLEAAGVEEEVIAILLRAIGELPPQSSRIMMLAAQGIKNQEIAASLGISVNSVKTLKYAAIRALKDKLGRGYEYWLWLLLLLP